MQFNVIRSSILVCSFFPIIILDFTLSNLSQCIESTIYKSLIMKNWKLCYTFCDFMMDFFLPYLQVPNANVHPSVVVCCTRGSIGKRFQGIDRNSYICILDFGTREPYFCTRNMFLYALSHYKLWSALNHLYLLIQFSVVWHGMLLQNYISNDYIYWNVLMIRTVVLL